MPSPPPSRVAVVSSQASLLEIDVADPPAPRAARQTSKAIGPGDIVEVDKKGRRFHALVTSLVQSDSGRFELELRPLERGITYRQATVREVVGVWRKAR
jgi:hypothetical protein